jgi:hypothetical protein
VAACHWTEWISRAATLQLIILELLASYPYRRHLYLLVLIYSPKFLQYDKYSIKRLRLSDCARLQKMHVGSDRSISVHLEPHDLHTACSRMVEISWTKCVKNWEVLNRVKNETYILSTVKRRKNNWICHILRRNYLLQKKMIEIKMEGRWK